MSRRRWHRKSALWGLLLLEGGMLFYVETCGQWWTDRSTVHGWPLVYAMRIRPDDNAVPPEPGYFRWYSGPLIVDGLFCVVMMASLIYVALGMYASHHWMQWRLSTLLAAVGLLACFLAFARLEERLPQALSERWMVNRRIHLSEWYIRAPLYLALGCTIYTATGLAVRGGKWCFRKVSPKLQPE
jgi:hypothetical protein